VHGFLWNNGVFTTIDAPDAAFNTATLDINDKGQIVGVHDGGSTGQVSFLLDKGEFIPLDVPFALEDTTARGINNWGDIVGDYTTSGGTVGHGFLATPSSTSSPVITIGSVTPAPLWPPNGKLVPVTITGSIMDADSTVNEITATYEVTDEYGLVEPSGSVPVDKVDEEEGSYTFTIQLPLRASRNGTDTNGRQYIITVRAFDNTDNEGSAATSVIVPHHQGQSIAAQ
jgi:hypothetical protein